MTEDSGILTVGTCIYTCNAIHGYYPLPCDISMVNNFTCEDLHRTGLLCGDCVDGYAPPVYSYDLRCVECKDYRYNWLKYLAAAFLPLTFFFFIVTVFSISFTSPRVCGVVLVYQLMANPTQLRVLVSLCDSGLLLLSKNIVNILTSIIAVWNLDFFRMAYKPFCLHPRMTTLHTLALDYAIAVYPLLLIMLTYLIVSLNDRGFRPVKWICGPILKLSKKFKRHCSLKTSLIDVFASFIFLSTARLLSASFILLVPSSSYSLNSTSLRVSVTHYVYNAPNVKYFSQEHLPFAIFIVLILNLLPMLLLFAYPLKSFQKLLNELNINSNKLRTFIEVFQGNIKDGTNGTNDYRFFSGFLLLLEFVLSALFCVTRSNVYYPIACVCILVYCCLLAKFQPYKRKLDNYINIIMMASFLSSYVGVTLNVIILRASHPLLDHKYPAFDTLSNISFILIGTGIVIPSLYLLGLMALLLHTKHKL